MVKGSGKGGLGKSEASKKPLLPPVEAGDLATSEFADDFEDEGLDLGGFEIAEDEGPGDQALPGQESAPEPKGNLNKNLFKISGNKSSVVLDTQKSPNGERKSFLVKDTPPRIDVSKPPSNELPKNNFLGFEEEKISGGDQALPGQPEQDHLNLSIPNSEVKSIIMNEPEPTQTQQKLTQAPTPKSKEVGKKPLSAKTNRKPAGKILGTDTAALMKQWREKERKLQAMDDHLFVQAEADKKIRPNTAKPNSAEQQIAKLEKGFSTQNNEEKAFKNDIKDRFSNHAKAMGVKVTAISRPADKGAKGFNQGSGAGVKTERELALEARGKRERANERKFALQGKLADADAKKNAT